MIDISDDLSAEDLIMVESAAPKAKNILNIQLGSLEYAPKFGVDLDYFLRNPIKFQNESFKAYLIETLANNGINLASLDTVVHSLYSDYIFNLAPEENSTAFIAR